MNENKTINAILNTELPASIDNAVKNLTDKPSITAGRILSDLMDLTLGQFSFWAEKVRTKRAYDLEQYRTKLLTSTNKIPPEKLIEPSLRLTAQALEDSKYCISEEELRNMFVSLISNSMNIDFCNYIHPSFSGIIKQMSALEAKIIALFNIENLYRLPVCQYCITISGIIGAPAIPEHIFLELPNNDIALNSISLESLSRFGLIAISYDKFLTDETLYEKFLTHPLYICLQKYSPLTTASIKKGCITLTPLGRSFVKVCVPD